jgi:hypothetical protein
MLVRIAYESHPDLIGFSLGSFLEHSITRNYYYNLGNMP